jgi:hypothetical protein
MTRVLKRPRLLYQSEIRRSAYWRRLPTLLLGLGGAAGAFWALGYANRQGVTDPLLLEIGQTAAVLLGALLFVKLGLNLFRGLTRRSERIRAYDVGIKWQRGGRVAKYEWEDVESFREGASGVYVGKQPILQWGAHRLTMEDGTILKVTPAHGDARRFAHAVRQPIADVTSARMSRALRQELPVRLHRRLTLYKGGIEANGKPIAWSRVRLDVRGGRLRVRQRRDGRVSTVARFGVGSIDNFGGLLELAETTIRHHDTEYKRKSQETARATQEMLRQRQGRA